MLLLAPLSVARADSLDLRAEAEFASAREALDPVNFVLAQATPPARSAPAAPASPARAPARPSSLALMRLFFQDAVGNGGLRVAPIRWRGNATIDHRLGHTSQGANRQTIEYLTFSAATYISQPWLAQVTGNLGLVASQNRDRPSGEAGEAVAGSRAEGFSVTGGASLSIFPTSRFPFTAMFQTADSRTSGEATSSDYVSRVISLRQSYRSPLGEEAYTASFNRSALTGAFGSDTVASLEATMQRRFDEHTLDVAGQLSRSRQRSGGVDSGRLTARHSYRPEESPYTIDTSAGLSLADFTALSGFRSHYFQLNSFGTWRPGEDSPWFVTGGAHLADASTEAAGQSASGRSVGVNVAASYALSRHANLVAGANVAWNGSHVVSGQTVAANYAPAAIPFGGFTYSWGAGASAGNHTGGPDGGQHVFGASVNHQVGRGVALGKSATLNAHVTQSIGWEQDGRGEAATRLGHSAALSLNVRPTDASNMLMSVSGGESRIRGAREDRLRMLNAQLSGQLQLGVFSILSANLTAQAIRQASQLDQEGERTSVFRSGTVSYRHSRLFGAPRLRLVLDASFADLQLESRLLGDVNAPRDQVTELYEARLEYDIGRLDFRLGTRLATIDGKRDRQVFLRVNRQFGLY